ncbi:MAG: 1-deoxy-D-xylulose-5-phosphate synthase [Desulfotomaculaceae bacterium]|nr:1-deoxy-D-xylulose-5-phosphate synthase [Desulfotomaculaceae bacterium]
MGSLLKQINSPDDVHSLSYPQLNKLAGEIRRLIIETVAKNGGHLAPSLGVVELTLGLYKVFHTPPDKILWDVGHQSYAHKIITGRREKFCTLRQLGGISGFLCPAESTYDVFGTGHSSTSISAALGMAVARDLSGEKYKIVAIIGDGALTGGMAFEALNNAGHLKKDLIVILNDNEMSIAQNVGAISGYLARLRTDPMYTRGKEELEQLMRKIPVGSALLRLGFKLRDSLKYLVVPGMIFEELGFIYLGPVDGHDIKQLAEVLRRAKNMKGPVLIHVLTKKGRGYKPAENNPGRFHGVGPFDPASGKVYKNSSIPSYTDIFGRAMSKLAHRNERVVAITAAMTSGTGLTNFARLYPKRFFDVGIAEQHAVTMAAGMAAGGYHPVVTIYSTFLQRAYDQILHDVCLQKLPVTFAIDRAGIVGEDGFTHNGLFDFAYLRPIPNMVVMAPKDENELQHMLATAIKHSGPAALRYPRGAGIGCALDDNLTPIPIGQAEVLKKGSNVTLLAIGNTVRLAVEAAAALEDRGISASVINARFVKPLDEECILHYAKQTDMLFTLEEHVLQGGFGSAVLELLSARSLKEIRTHCFGIPDVFVEHGSPAILRDRYGLTVKHIVETVAKKIVHINRSKGLKIVADKK